MAHALELPRTGQRGSKSDSAFTNSKQWVRVKDLGSPPWLKEICDRINEVSLLPSGWDTHSASPVATRASSHARILISNLNLEDFPRPSVSAIADGGIGFHWRLGQRDLELEITSDGEILFLKTPLDTPES